MPLSENQASWFTAPSTGEPLENSSGSDFWQSVPTKIQYPLLNQIPWLLPDPAVALAQVQNRASSLIGTMSNMVQALGLQAQGTNSSETKQRLSKLSELQKAKLEFLNSVLAPLKLSEWPKNLLPQHLGYEALYSQGLLWYYRNIARDWCFETGENQKSLDALSEVIDNKDMGATLVLGAGACRLAYDFHQRYQPSRTIAIDSNPVYLFVAQKILSGESVGVPELHFAPIESIGEILPTKLPEPVKAGFSFAFADVYFLPFADNSVDTVVTPWLVDILPRPFHDLANEIFRVLKPSGRWLNTGSLNFTTDNVVAQLSLKEIQTTLHSMGFEIFNSKRRSIPYLESPYSAQLRMETVTSFSATKTKKRAVPRNTIVSTTKIYQASIPLTSRIVDQKNLTQVHMHILSWIDGERTGPEIAALLAKQYGLESSLAEQAVRNFLIPLITAGKNPT